MVDNDIFSKSVARPWRRAARAVFAPELTDYASVTAVRAAADQLREGGCPSLPGLLAVVRRLREDTRPPMIDLLDDLEEIERQHFDGMTRVAADVIRRWAVIDHRSTLLTRIDETGVVAEILTDFILRKVLPADTSMRLQRSGEWQAAEIEERRNEFRFQVRSSPWLTKLAGQLLKDPSGGKITRPRMKRPPVNQQDLVESFALTT